MHGLAAAFLTNQAEEFLARVQTLILALALLAILIVALVPSLVVTQRDKGDSSSEAQRVDIVETTVVDGVTRTLTKTGELQTRTQLETRSDGQVVTVTSLVTLAPVTVSPTNLIEPTTGE